MVDRKPEIVTTLDNTGISTTGCLKGSIGIFMVCWNFRDMAGAKFNMATAKPEVVFTGAPVCDVDAVPKAMVGFQGSTNIVEVQPIIILLRVTLIFHMATAILKVLLTFTRECDVDAVSNASMRRRDSQTQISAVNDVSILCTVHFQYGCRQFQVGGRQIDRK
jgi:hypothetical protein